MEAITLTESKRLVTLEKVITAGEKTWLEVGEALTEIRDCKLYRADFKTFDAYLDGKWGWTRMRASQLIGAAEVVKSLPENVNHGLQNERQARELSKVPPDKRPEVLEKAASKAKSEHRPLTARDINSAAPPSKKPEPVVEKVLDSTGYPVPDDALALWNRSHEAQEILTYISTIKSKILKAMSAEDLLFRCVNFNSVLAALHQAYEDCKRAKPYAVCPTCLGKLAKQCSACGGAGLVDEFYWKTCVPKETREAREGKS